MNICVTNDHGYVPLVVSTSRSFPHSRLITGFVTRLTRRLLLVDQELFALPRHHSSQPVFSGVRVTRSQVLCGCFIDRCLSFCTFFLLTIVLSVRYMDADCPFWYLQTLLIHTQRQPLNTLKPKWRKGVMETKLQAVKIIFIVF